MITVVPVQSGVDGEVLALDITVPKRDIVMFRELVQRATNLWADAPAEIKHFADLVTNGKPYQDYFQNPHLSGDISRNILNEDASSELSRLADERSYQHDR